MSEMRRAARALVDRRTERHESRFPMDESERRLVEELQRARLDGAVGFTRRWEPGTQAPTLVVELAPARRTMRLLNALSFGMALLLAASVWSLASDEATRALRFAVPIFTLLAILGFPFVALGLASRREAEEARIAKAIRVALRDEEPGYPPAHRWADES